MISKLNLKAGDQIVITKEEFDAMPNDYKHGMSAKGTLTYLFGFADTFGLHNDGEKYIPESTFPLRGMVHNKRLGRNHGQLMIEWDVPEDAPMKETNVYFLEEIGYTFIQPEFDEIPILDADDEILTEDERVKKYLMIKNGWRESEADEFMSKLTPAMYEAEVVFYRP